MDKCYYCSQEPIVETDCLGHTCCKDCWEESMKDWTLEKEAELKKQAHELCQDIRKWHAEIKAENGLPEDAPGFPCLSCRKMVQCDKHGNFYCECHDERKGISPDDPGVVLIPERFMRGS